LIDHGNGFQTLYAHLKAYNVKVGDSVAKGQKIGEVGITGNSSGPHLHFEIRQGEGQRNPFGFLP
jgi:murein DD-endopeptidase MepM/ murein hydrolase activator NlpD